MSSRFDFSVEIFQIFVHRDNDCDKNIQTKVVKVKKKTNFHFGYAYNFVIEFPIRPLYVCTYRFIPSGERQRKMKGCWRV